VTLATLTENSLANYGDFAARAAGHRLPWLKRQREEAFARFRQLGFPTTRDEDWRFTNVSAITQTPFRLASGSEQPPARETIESYRIPGVKVQLVFVNGRFVPELSLAGDLPPGVEVGSLAAKLESAPGEIEPLLGRAHEPGRDAFAALNTAFLEDGGYIRIGKGVVVEEPICLLFVSTGSAGAPLMSHLRNLIVAEENSQASFIEDYVSLNAEPAFSNSATVLVAGSHSVLSHFMIERENMQSFNVSTLRVELARAADVASHSVLLGGALVRNNVHPVLGGEGAECLINGLFIGGGEQHLDNYMMVEHASPRCASRQFYNGILDGRASGVFHGRIIVQKDAQKTDAKQTNRNLLLSDDASIDTKPQLEIYADDVKCTHGATIGQIEAEALFYLRSRGIDEADARKLLLLAFASECLDRIKAGAAHTHIEGLIHDCLARVAHSVLAVSSGEKTAGRNWEEIG
jgi:Fe-S cluster assembly protein SufD